MSLTQAYDLLGDSPLGRALAHYIQNGMASNFLHRITLRLCYWYQSINGYQTTTLDGRIYRRTRTTLEELRYAYILWQRDRCQCRCGCQVNNAGLGPFSFVVNCMRDEGWLGEGSEDDWVTAGRDGRFLEDERRTELVSRRRDIRAMRRGREQSRASSLGNILSNSSTDESARSPPRGQRSPNENHPGLTPLRYSGDQLMSWRREDAINSRSRSSPPGASTEQRNSLVITLRASSDRRNCRNISTTTLLNRIMGRSDAGGSNLNRRVHPSLNISRRTSRRSRGSSMNGRGMRDPPNLPMAQGTGRNSHAPSRISTRRRSGSVDSLMADGGRTRVLPQLDTSRLVERLATLSEAERSSWSARVDDIYLDHQAASADNWEGLVDRWRRLSFLLDQLSGA